LFHLFDKGRVDVFPIHVAARVGAQVE
jgi:hypothetical protein